jgi:hypothetical protein
MLDATRARFAALGTALYLGLCGCAQSEPVGCALVPDPLAELVVVEAALDGLSLSHTAAFVGPAGGSAELVVLDVDDVEHRFPATLRGTTTGALVHASAAVTFDAPVPLDLGDQERSARELLGTYDGPVAGLDAGLGVTWRRLENDVGVVFVVAGLSAGLGIALLAFESLELALEDDPVLDATNGG